MRDALPRQWFSITSFVEIELCQKVTQNLINYTLCSSEVDGGQ
jgi:hypothetical protein